MDHVVYLNTHEKELYKILNLNKTMIIRGGDSVTPPFGLVKSDDNLYFLNNLGDGLIKARAKVIDVFQSENLSLAESIDLVESNNTWLMLSEEELNRWSLKSCIILIEFTDVEKINGFYVDRRDFEETRSWLTFKDINEVKIAEKK